MDFEMLSYQKLISNKKFRADLISLLSYDTDYQSHKSCVINAIFK
jgi:hypothetical protein